MYLLILLSAKLHFFFGCKKRIQYSKKYLGHGGPAIRQYWPLVEKFLKKQPDIILVYTSGPAAGTLAYATRWVSTSCFSKLNK